MYVFNNRLDTAEKRTNKLEIAHENTWKDNENTQAKTKRRKEWEVQKRVCEVCGQVKKVQRV